MADTQNVLGATRYTVSADHGDVATFDVPIHGHPTKKAFQAPGHPTIVLDRARHLTDLAAALRSVADELDQEAKSND